MVDVTQQIILATAGYDKQIKFWNIKNQQCYEQKKMGEASINRLVLSQDKRYIGACTNGLVKVFDMGNLEQGQEMTFDGLTGNAVTM